MADAKLRIVIDALNKASDDLGKLKKDIQGVDDSSKQAEGGVKKFGGGLSSMIGKVAIASAAIAAVGVALKQVYTAAKEGAELQYTATRFENLAKAVGTTADALKNDMRDATQGMMSDAELMGSAADFMALGLAKSHDEVVRLSSVAGQLGMNMNQLVLTLTNKTTMRFDALGVSVDGFDEKVKALEASGMSVQDAFTEAFLQQAEEQILKVGSASDSTIGDFMRLEAAVKNMADSFKVAVAEVIAPAVGTLAHELEIAQGWTVDFTGSTFAMADGWENAASRAKFFQGAQEGLNAAVQEGTISQQAAQIMLEQVALSTMSTAEAIAFIKGKMDDYKGSVNAATLDTGYYNDQIEIAAGKGEEWAIQLLAERDALKEAGGAARDAAADMQTYSDKALFAKASSELSAEQAYALATAMGLIDENTAFANEKLAEYRSMLDNGQISVSEYKALVEGLADAIARLEGKDVDINVNVNYTTSGELPLNEDWVIDNDDFDKPTATGGQRYKGDPYRWQEYGYRGEVFVPSEDGFVLSRADAMRAVAMGKGTRGFASGGYLTMQDPTYTGPGPSHPYYGHSEMYGSPDPAVFNFSRPVFGGSSSAPAQSDGVASGSVLSSAVGEYVDMSSPDYRGPAGHANAMSMMGGYSGASYRRAGVAFRAGGAVIVNNYSLTMPTSNNPIDVAMAFDLMQAYGGI